MKSHRVDFHWLSSKARVIQRQQPGEESVKLGKHVVVQFLHKYKVRLRMKQRNKAKSKESFIIPLQKWHATIRERFIRTSRNNNFDEKWGAFLPKQRFNVDQSPLPFVINAKKTYDIVEESKGHEHNTWISQPGSGLDKRQCSLQVCIRAEGKQPPVGIVFRGKGKRIRPDEMKAWHPDVHVFFQQNAWVDTLQPFAQEEQVGHFILFADNLTAQESGLFKGEIASADGVVCYGLPGTTDLWQPVDAGVAKVLKTLTVASHRDWLDFDNNANRWYGNEQPYTASERRVLLTHWTGDAWNRMISDPKYVEIIRNAFVRTGCLLTANGEHGELVRPEGLTDYKVPPPSMVEPTVEVAVSSDDSEQVSGRSTDNFIDENDVEMVEESEDIVEGQFISFISDSDVICFQYED